MKRLRVYLSSTFEDLRPFRDAASAALEQAGLDLARMEGYVAADERPLDLCLADVARCDVYVGIVGWRNGYVPPAAHGNPEGRSITALEYRRAGERSLTRLLFLAHPDTQKDWPAAHDDARSGGAEPARALQAWRDELRTETTVGFFRTPADLAQQLLAALLRLDGAGRRRDTLPPPASDFVERPVLAAAVADALLSTTDHVVLHGGGGFGKTALARALVQEPRIAHAFPDGMLWVTLGEQPDLAQRLADLAGADLADPLLALRRQWEGRRCLIVVDDLWRADDLAPFLQIHGARLLVTTRDPLLPARAGRGHWTSIAVADMAHQEAVALLARDLQTGPAERRSLGVLASALGTWPLLLVLAHARLREEALARHGDLRAAVATVHRLYKQRGVTGFDQHSRTARNAAVRNSVAVSLESAEAQAPGTAARAEELSVFPEDTPIALAWLAQWWGIDEFSVAEDVLRPLNAAGLLLTWDRDAGRITLHDLVRAALAQRLAPRAAAVHGQLADAWPDRLRLPHDYAWRHLASHLAAAGRQPELRRLLGDLGWLQAKLRASGVAALVADYASLAEADPLARVGQALQMSASYLAQDPSQLPSQLLGRLRPGGDADLEALCRQAAAWRGEPWLRPLQPSLRAAGGPLVRVFRGYAGGHAGSIRSVAIDPQGRWAATGGNSHNDQTVILWELDTGNAWRLEGEARGGDRTALALSAGAERLLTAYGAEVRMWRRRDHALEARLAHGEADVTALAISDDGEVAIAGCKDGSVVRWDLARREALLLGQHPDPVTHVAIAPDGARAASSDTQQAWLWDLHPAHHTHAVALAGAGSRCFVLSSDGRCIAWGGGHAQPAGLWMHDTVSDAGGLLASHPSLRELLAFAAESPRCLVTHQRSDDPYNRDEYPALLTVEPHPRLLSLAEVGRGIFATAISRDGRVGLTTDYEHDVMVWNLDRVCSDGPPFDPLPAPWDGHKFAGFTHDSRHAVFDADQPEPLAWDVVANRPADAAEARAAARKLIDTPAAATPASELTAPDSAPSRGHASRWYTGAVAPGGLLDASVSEDGTCRVWDRTRGRPLAVFSDEAMFAGCTWTPDARTLAVIDRRGHAHLLRVEGFDDTPMTSPE